MLLIFLHFFDYPSVRLSSSIVQLIYKMLVLLHSLAQVQMGLHWNPQMLFVTYIFLRQYQCLAHGLKRLTMPTLNSARIKDRKKERVKELSSKEHSSCVLEMIWGSLPADRNSRVQSLFCILNIFCVKQWWKTEIDSRLWTPFFVIRLPLSWQMRQNTISKVLSSRIKVIVGATCLVLPKESQSVGGWFKLCICNLVVVRSWLWMRLRHLVTFTPRYIVRYNVYLLIETSGFSLRYAPVKTETKYSK